MTDPIQHAINTLDPEMSRHEIVNLREALIKSKAEPTQLDNLLVEQKDNLIRSIDNAKNFTDLQRMRFCLLILRPLWIACNYDYKYLELTERIARKQSSFRIKEQS